MTPISFPTTTDVFWCNNCQSCIVDEADTHDGGRVHSIITIARCKCSSYPVVCGILLYTQNRLSIDLCTGRIGSKNLGVLIKLLETNRLAKICLALIILPYTTAVRVLGRMPARSVRLLLHDCILLILKLTTGKTSLWSYIQKRNTLPSYYVSLFTQSIIPKRQSMYVDVGCSNGILLQWIFERSTRTTIVGIDQSFLFLLLARLFIVDTKILLAKATADDLPIRPHTAQTLTINDTWQYLPKNKKLVKTLGRSVANSGVLAMFHIYNPAIGDEHELVCRPTTPSHTQTMLRKSGFPYVSLLLNDTLFSSLFSKQKMIKVSKSESDIDACDSYSLIASKGPLRALIIPHNAIDTHIRQYGIIKNFKAPQPYEYYHIC